MTQKIEVFLVFNRFFRGTFLGRDLIGSSPVIGHPIRIPGRLSVTASSLGRQFEAPEGDLAETMWIQRG